MKIRNLITIILVLAIVSCQTDEKPEMSSLVKQEKYKDGIFLHISSGYENPQKISMALSLAVKMTETKDVAVFFDINGVKVLAKDAEDIQMEHFFTVQNALDTLIKKNVLIMACPMCLAQAEINADNLKEGITIAEKEKFFSFTKGRILTLSY